MYTYLAEYNALLQRHICFVTYSKRVTIPYEQGALSHINTTLWCKSNAFYVGIALNLKTNIYGIYSDPSQGHMTSHVITIGIKGSGTVAAAQIG